MTAAPFPTQPRKALAKVLKPLLPRTWAIIDSSRAIDRITRTTVQLRQTEIKRTPGAPLATHDIDFLVTIAVPEAATQAAEDKLDEQIDDLIHALDVAGLAWRDCRKVVTFEGQRLGYDLTLTIHSTKKEN